nr:protein IQ-DOMAIN 14-like [Arachis hypogaea]
MKPVNSEEYWVNTGLLSPEPPIIRRPAGRRKKKRKADPVEDARDRSKGRRTFKVTCQKCGESGHNAKTCKGPPRPKPPPKNKGKKKREKTTNSSNQVASTTSFRPPRPKQQILRPHVAPVTAPTPPMKLVSAPRPLPPSTLTPPPTAPFAPVPRSLHPNQIPRISPETVAATSSRTVARIFKFMPTPGLNLQKKK